MQRSRTIPLILVVIACILSAGCTQPPAVAEVPATGVPAPEPPTPVPSPVTAAPREVVTVIHYVSPPRDLRDSSLLFALRVPAAWNVSTRRMARSDTSDYRTELVADDVFFIITGPITRSREQEYRDRFRQEFPSPVETMATINDIRYDRFEGSAGGNTTVAYIAHATSANERGYGSMLVFTTPDSNRFLREDFEDVVSSFRYFSGRSACTIPGEEIPLYDPLGNPVARTAIVPGSRVSDTADWDSAGPDYSDPGPSTDDSSEGGSTGGGGCNR